MKRFLSWAAKAFLLASLLAVFLPMPRYARSLEQGQYLIWLARLVWVLLLTVGCGVLMVLGGILAKRWERRRQASLKRPPDSQDPSAKSGDLPEP